MKFIKLTSPVVLLRFVTKKNYKKKCQIIPNTSKARRMKKKQISHRISQKFQQKNQISENENEDQEHRSLETWLATFGSHPWVTPIMITVANDGGGGRETTVVVEKSQWTEHKHRHREEEINLF